MSIFSATNSNSSLKVSNSDESEFVTKSFVELKRQTKNCSAKVYLATATKRFVTKDALSDDPSVASATHRRRSQRRFSDAQAATVPASLQRRFDSDAPATVPASLQRRSGSDGPSVASATLRQRRSGDGPSVASATLRQRRSQRSAPATTIATSLQVSATIQRHFSDDPAATIPVKRSGDDDPNIASVSKSSFSNSSLGSSLIVGSLEHIFKKEGLRGMYRGLSPTMIALLPKWAIESHLFIEILTLSPSRGKASLIYVLHAALSFVAEEIMRNKISYWWL
nr:nicotinamide adenine dinucleotide transporter 1, chloroplastic [Quercus suber]